MTIEGNEIVATFPASTRGNYSLNLKATDIFEDFATIDFNIEIQNNAPIFYDVADQVAYVNILWEIYLENVCYDIENDELTVNVSFSETL